MLEPENSQRTIMITGCSSGIGEYCAYALKKAGWKVFATARTTEDLQRLEEGGVHSVYLEYTDPNSIHKAFDEVMVMSGGRLDALFNNGAYGQAGAVEDLSTEALRMQFETNFFGWHELTMLAVRQMRKQGHGRIVQCSSVLGFTPMAWRGAYNASKFALEGLSRTMRVELKGSNIHLSLIQPGPIKTKFLENGIPYFERNIDRENSPHREEYVKQMERLNSGGGVNRFRLGSDAVYKSLDHALNAKKPRAHYLVTVPTYVMAIAKRILPYSLLERMLR